MRPPFALPLVLSLVALVPSPAQAFPGPGPSPDPGPVSHQGLQDVDRFIQDQEQRWRREDRACDPNAVFALTYLIMTRYVRDYIANLYFDDNEFLAEMDVFYGQYYLAAVDSWERGETEGISEPWLDAFQWGASGQSTVTEDLLIAISAHVNYDLAVTTWQLHLARDGRKADFDRINDVLAAATREITTEIARHYDPSLTPNEGSDFTDPVTLQLLVEWRENAWYNSVLLENAPSDEARQAHLDALADAVVLHGKALQTPKESTREARVAYCEANP